MNEDIAIELLNVLERYAIQTKTSPEKILMNLPVAAAALTVSCDVIEHQTTFHLAQEFVKKYSNTLTQIIKGGKK